MLFAVEHELKSLSMMMEPDIKINHVQEDDNKILEYAVSWDCDYIISGDHHLLSIGKYSAIEIKHVSDFLNEFGLS